MPTANAMLRLLLLGLLVVLVAACGRETGAPGDFAGAGSQRLFVIEIDGEAAGRLEERRGLTTAGAPRMDTRVEIILPGSGLMLREERLQFAAEPPHELLQRTRFTRTPTGIEHHEVTQGEALGTPTLRDFDGMRQLASAPVGSRIRQDDIGLGSERPMATAWKVESQDNQGTLARGRRDDGAEVAVWLGPDGSPRYYRIGSGFAVRQVDVAPELPVDHGGPLLMEVATGLGDPERIERLRVHVSGPAADLFQDGPGLELRRTDAGVELHGRRLDATPELREEQRRLLEAMVAEVRHQLRYHPGAAPPSIHALLADGRGDCYEFAALFAALAREAGFEARLVTGLAWAGDERQGFAPHAWNEVRIGNSWLSVDPTWDQVGADAARLRFPDDPSAQLDLQLALKRSRIEVIAVEPAG